MLIALYYAEMKTKRWCIKVFWYFDMSKVSAWPLYCQNHQQYSFSSKYTKVGPSVVTEKSRRLNSCK